MQNTISMLQMSRALAAVHRHQCQGKDEQHALALAGEAYEVPLSVLQSTYEAEQLSLSPWARRVRQYELQGLCLGDALMAAEADELNERSETALGAIV